MQDTQGLNDAVVIQNLWKIFGDEHQDAALRGVELTVRKGETVALCGKSGSGKTTLLNIISALDSPSKGSVLVFGNDLFASPEKERVLFRRLRLGYIFQEFHLLPTLTVGENVSLSAEFAGLKNSKEVSVVLSRVGLLEMKNRFPHQLSGGEQQRVAIARAMVKNPNIILADEPTGNLDSINGKIVMEMLIEQVRERGATLIYTTHANSIALYADRILHIKDGLVEEGPCTSGE